MLELEPRRRAARLLLVAGVGWRAWRIWLRVPRDARAKGSDLQVAASARVVGPPCSGSVDLFLDGREWKVELLGKLGCEAWPAIRRERADEAGSVAGYVDSREGIVMFCESALNQAV